MCALGDRSGTLGWGDRRVEKATWLENKDGFGICWWRRVRPRKLRECTQCVRAARGCEHARRARRARQDDWVENEQR